jgi:uncharacterized protein YjiS (DUF1127 family)
MNMSYYGTQDLNRLEATRTIAYVPSYEIERQVRQLRAQAMAKLVRKAIDALFAAPKAAPAPTTAAYVLTLREQAYLERGERIADIASNVVVAFRKLLAEPATAQRELPLESYKLSVREQAYLARGEKLADALIWVGTTARKVASWLYAPVKAWRSETLTRDELMLLDDRTLADIGLTRGDIPRVAAGLWVPENRLAQVSRADRPVSVSNVNKPPLAA